MKKNFAKFGLFVSIVVIIVGLVIVTSSPKEKMDIYPDYYYDYGYAQFGSDYYSYSNNNAAYSAKASIAAGYQTQALDKTIRTVGGLLLLTVGMMGLGAFGMVACCEDPKNNIPGQEPCATLEISNTPAPGEVSAPGEADASLT